MPSKEHVVEIYKVESEKYNKTRDIQWRMNFAVWTLISLAIAAKAKQEFNLSHSLNNWLEILIYFIFAAFYGWFIWRMQKSLNNSLRRMRYLVKYTLESRETQKLNWDDTYIKENLPLAEKRKENLSTGTWIAFEMVITIALLIILLLTNDTIIFG